MFINLTKHGVCSIKKLFTFTVSMIATLILFTGVASAHVTIQPEETSQGKYEVFTVRVPSENEEVPTTKVEVIIPDEVHITRFEPKPGWTYEVQKDDTDKITSVIWTTEEEGLSPTEFAHFNMQGRVDDAATEIVWKSYQTYKDGSVIDWIGSPGSDKPASVTAVNQADITSNHGHLTTDASFNEKGVSEDESVENNVAPPSNNVPLYLSIAALIAGLLSLIIALKNRG